jgi:hypothetical protein
MADVIKSVDRGIPATERSQTFSESDAGAGDLILVQDSLGKPAKTMTIDAAAAMTVRFNVRRVIFPRPDLNDGFSNSPNGDIRRFNLSKPQVVEDTTMALVSIGAGESFALDNDMPVRDIKIESAAGAFDIFVA